MKRSRVGPGIVATLLTALIAAISGCSGPEFTYVKDNDGGTYFRVPANWVKIDQALIEERISGEDPQSASAQVRKKLVWTAAFDGNAKSPDPAHFIPYDVAGSDEPFVYSTVLPLTEEQRNMVSLDMIRNIIPILPVTKTARASMLEQFPTFPLKNFELLEDEVLEPGDGIRGVHVRFNYKLGTPSAVHTYDLTAYLNSDSTKMSMLLVQCSATCYRQRAKELDAITSSFTVKKLIG